ncbi:hypothetical protein F4677DRAFT_444598 [Hypoxylon crocopeplum]|nr:hypothetical protein F4677DRAFT_444598 [Hypoxylon crocopeplum]
MTTTPTIMPPTSPFWSFPSPSTPSTTTSHGHLNRSPNHMATARAQTAGTWKIANATANVTAMLGVVSVFMFMGRATTPAAILMHCVMPAATRLGLPGELPADRINSFSRTRTRNRTAQTPSLSTDVTAPYSDAGGSKNTSSNATHSTKDDHKLSRVRVEDARNENARTRVRKLRGRPPRPWSTDDETRLLEYLSKDMDWSDIATALKRSESGVRQHARMMEQERTAWPTLDDRRLRAYMIEGTGWSEIAKRLKRPEDAVVMRWRTIVHE